MRIRKSFRLALNILLHSKIRSWLTIIGIVIGVAAFVGIVSIGEGAQASVQARLGGLGADIITVSPGFNRAAGGFRGGGGGDRIDSTISSNAKNLTQKDIQVIKTIEGVNFINGIVSGRASLTYLAETSSVSIQGVDALAWKNMITIDLESGRYLDAGDSNENVIVLGNRIAQKTFKQPLALNRDVSIYINDNPGKTFKIVGILTASGTGSDDNTIFMPVSAARDILEKGTDKIDSISIKVSSPELTDQVANETSMKLMISRHVTDKTKDFSVTTAKAIQERIAGVTDTITLFLGAIAAVSLLVGAVGIANTMFTSVLEKTKEIGIMKAIGARNFDIMLIFLFNSGLVGLVGGLIGIIIGSGISALIPSLLSGIGGFGPGGGVKTVIPLSLLTEALLISVIIGMVAGVIPAYRASKLKPVDALRYE